MVAKRRTQPRKSPRQERSKQTVKWLLDATVEVLSKEGYKAASTNRIAQKAGVNIASLYQYFPRKEALVAALIDRQIDRMQELVGRELGAVAGLPLAQAIPVVIGALMNSYVDD